MGRFFFARGHIFGTIRGAAVKVIRTSELRRLDVINVEEGRYMGSVCDVDLDPDTGRINALIVDEVKPLSFFFRCQAY